MWREFIEQKKMCSFFLVLLNVHAVLIWFEYLFGGIEWKKMRSVLIHSWMCANRNLQFLIHEIKFNALLPQKHLKLSALYTLLLIFHLIYTVWELTIEIHWISKWNRTFIGLYISIQRTAFISILKFFFSEKWNIYSNAWSELCLWNELCWTPYNFLFNPLD